MIKACHLERAAIVCGREGIAPSDPAQLCETHEATVAGNNAANLSISGNQCPSRQTKLSPKHHRLTSVQHDPVLHVPPHRARKCHAFHIAPD
jgi:hypothetical protein